MLPIQGSVATALIPARTGVAKAISIDRVKRILFIILILLKKNGPRELRTGTRPRAILNELPCRANGLPGHSYTSPGSGRTRSASMWPEGKRGSGHPGRGRSRVHRRSLSHIHSEAPRPILV